MYTYYTKMPTFKFTGMTPPLEMILQKVKCQGQGHQTYENHCLSHNLRTIFIYIIKPFNFCMSFKIVNFTAIDFNLNTDIESINNKYFAKKSYLSK